MGSTRFPGKPMASIHGMPMIGHVYKRTEMAKGLSATYVATCDQEIFDYIKSIGGNVVMTADTHERCTDRTSEALLKIEEELNERMDIVVMVQGDEPMVYPEMIDESLGPFNTNNEVNVVNLMGVLKTFDEAADPNEVKVVVDKFDKALYFSREPIPSRKKFKGEIQHFKQVCIIPFRRDYLLKFNELPETPLERIESVDMMRILEHGEDVWMVRTSYDTYSVDTPEDLASVEKLMVEDELKSSYLE
jgi:3-deoxy-manno-octulosonate cytidylyltransferase (CMP-KDO synthetase)